jgi:uncharacterized protein involved in exopolysaccharide biosynthesis
MHVPRMEQSQDTVDGSRARSRPAAVRDHQDSSSDRFEEEIDFGRYLRPLSRYWLLLVVGALIGAAAGLIISLRRPTSFQASTTLLVQQADSPTALATSLALLRNSTLAAETIGELGLDKAPYRLTPQRFVEGVLAIEQIAGTHLLRVKITLPEANVASQASNLISTKAVDLTRRIVSEGNTTLRSQLKVLLDDAGKQLRTAEQELLNGRSTAQIEVLRRDTEVTLDERGQLRRLMIDIAAEKSRLAAAELEIKNHQPLAAGVRSVESEEALRRVGRAMASEPAGGRTPAGAGGSDADLLDLSNPTVNPVYQTLSLQIAMGRTRLAGMERERQEIAGTGRPGGAHVDQLTVLHRGQIEIERLQNNYELAKREYTELAVRYEQSRMESVGNTVRLQIVDHALPPEQPMPRKRAESVLLGLTAGSFLAALWALALGRLTGAPERLPSRP